jgi:NAD(P)-dependent dehydrogenase (short-subunit alcohol dehydrogenase family)
MSTFTSAPNSPSILDQFSIKDKVVVITGGGRGLGLNFALALAQCGAQIAAIDLHQKPHDDFGKLASYGGKAKYYRFVTIKSVVG